MNRRSSAFGLILTALLLCSAAFAPIASAQAETKTNETAWGLTYDWTYLDDDVEAMTGISFVDILTDVMGAADDADLELLIGQATTGETNVIFEQWTGADVTEGGVTLTPQVTQMTISHGTLNDVGVVTSWEEDDVSFDIALSVDTEEYLSLNVEYTEFLNSDGELVSMEIDLSFASSSSIIIDLEGEVSGGGETLPIDIAFEAGISFDITEAHGEAAPESPSQLYNDLDPLSAPFSFYWDCDSWTESASSSSESYEGHSSASLSEPCDDYTGNFANAASYNVEFSGFPAEDIGLEADDVSISISDSTSDSGSFTMDEYSLDGSMEVMDTTQDITVDGAGTLVTVNQAEAFPGPLAMPAMAGILLENAVAGSEGGDSIWEAFGGDIEGLFWADAMDESSEGESEEYFVCNNGEEIPSYWVNDGDEDCADGEDEYGGGSDGGSPSFVCGDGEEIPFSWVNDDYEDCGDGSDEPQDYDGDNSTDNWFDCNDGSEISMDWVNDGMWDCADGEDEGESPLMPYYYLDDMWIEGDGNTFEFNFWSEDLVDNGTYELAYTITGPDSFERTDSEMFTGHSGGQETLTSTGIAGEGALVEGEYCISSTLSDSEGGSIDNVGMDELCQTYKIEPEPSERLETIVDAFAESTIENVMNSFGENLEGRLGDIEGTAPYEDARGYALYDSASMRIIGVQLIAIDPTMSYSFIGPESSVYSEAPTTTHIEYLVGDAASAAGSATEDVELADMVDDSAHDTSSVDTVLDGTGVADDRAEDNPDEPPSSTTGSDCSEAAGKDCDIVDDDTGSLIPFVSPLSVLGVIALAGIFFRRQDA